MYAAVEKWDLKRGNVIPPHKLNKELATKRTMPGRETRFPPSPGAPPELNSHAKGRKAFSPAVQNR